MTETIYLKVDANDYEANKNYDSNYCDPLIITKIDDNSEINKFLDKKCSIESAITKEINSNVEPYHYYKLKCSNNVVKEINDLSNNTIISTESLLDKDIKDHDYKMKVQDEISYKVSQYRSQLYKEAGF
ncbi:MAG: hypothetical protein Satyrvirus11_5 [Satyrvirus sp.]|uniref:Uncharacterized protein n=1 Tax=Satyrvirus sp. TaxID=2487771 RepID=A0A3G5AHG8_9VIRU|nr:MAG: hypothetical protein Satyrvirus11_5 [Satyrvirus sp.]